MLGYIQPITNYLEEFLDRPNFINQYTKVTLFYCNPPKHISDKFTLLESFGDVYNQVWSQLICKVN